MQGMSQNVDFCHFLWVITLINLCLFKIIRKKIAYFLFPEQSLLVVVLFAVCPLIADYLHTSHAGLSCICIVRPVWRVLPSRARSSWCTNTGWVELFSLFCYYHHTVSEFECNLCLWTHTCRHPCFSVHSRTEESADAHLLWRSPCPWLSTQIYDPWKTEAGVFWEYGYIVYSYNTYQCLMLV